MRFATRAFAFCFIPFALVLGISFWSLRSRVKVECAEQLRSAPGWQAGIHGGDAGQE